MVLPAVLRWSRLTDLTRVMAWPVVVLLAVVVMTACASRPAPAPAPTPVPTPTLGTVNGAYEPGGPYLNQFQSWVISLRDTKGHTYSVTTSADAPHTFSIRLPPGTYSVVGCGSPASVKVVAGQSASMYVVCAEW